MKQKLPVLIIIAGIVGALLTAWYFKRSATVTPRKPVENTALTKSPTGSAKLGAEPAHALGSMDAPVMLEEFGDFECPPCGALHPVLKSLKSEFGTRLVIVFRQFPMVSLHKHATAAARAAEAAGLQGKFWEMQDLLYQNQTTWHEASDVTPIFEQYATTIGLDLDRFKRDLMSEMVEKRIALDRERGYWIGVNGTPTVFLNGREVPADSLVKDKLRALIEAQPR